MPQIKVDNEMVEVPRFAPGSEILEHPVVKDKAKGDRTVFLVDADNRGMEIVDPAKQYELHDGVQIETTAPSVSGGQ